MRNCNSTLILYIIARILSTKSRESQVPLLKKIKKIKTAINPSTFLIK
jgi:hypothetical protein